MNKIAVVGSMAFDSIETPTGKAENVVGGAATYFALSASFFAPVAMVAVVGEDFPTAELDFLKSRGIDISGIEIAKGGRTFRWSGRYHENMNLRDTLDLQLNVFADFSPKLPGSYRDSDYCFLANINPSLQLGVLDQLNKPHLVGADTMNFWIETTRPELEKLLHKVEILTINDEEAGQLSGEHNIVLAARKIISMGPKHVIIKRGEYGALHFSADSIFAVPAYPLENVVDPTGAGDTFAGGLMGSLASAGSNPPTSQHIRQAIAYGTVMASFVVEDFGFARLRKLTRDDIDHRYRQFIALTQI